MTTSSPGRLRVSPYLEFFGSRWGTGVAAVVAFAIALLHGTAQTFVYDAGNYWHGTQALISGGNFYDLGRLDLRGALTVVVYLPAALTTELLGNGAAGVAVLVQNAFMVTTLSIFVIPKLVRLMVPTRAIHLWISAILCSLLLSGFAPYSLMDMWAIAFLLAGILLVSGSNKWWVILLGGLVLGVAVNLRPACLAPLGIGGLVWIVFRWRLVVWPLIGAAATLIPQTIISRIYSGHWHPWPALTFLLASLQSQSAAYIVRYDTIAYIPSSDPRLSYCDPSYAAGLGSAPLPDTAFQLALSYYHHLPSSLFFLAQKFASSLYWSWLTPYSGQANAPFSILTLLVIAVTTVGILALVRLTIRHPTRSGLMMVLLLIAVWLGALATILFAQPESRFSLPLIIIGLIGCLTLIPTGRPHIPRTSGPWIWVACAVVFGVALLMVGASGLAHPASVGLVGILDCLHS